MGTKRKSKLLLAALVSAAAIGVNGCGGTTQSTTPTHSTKTLTSISITPSNASVPLGNSEQFAAVGIFSDGSQQDLTHTVAWNSSQSGIATIVSPGLAAGKHVGKTVIAAASGTVSASASLTISQAALLSLYVTPANPTIPKGETQQLSAMGTFSDGTSQNMTNAVLWTAAQPGVASLSNSGLLMAQNQGATIISATSGSIIATDGIQVSAPVLLSIAVSPAAASIPQGFQEQPFSAIGNFSDGSQQNITDSVAWTTAPPEVATIDSSGSASTLAVGTATIAATLSGVTGSATLNVTAPLMYDIDYFTNANTTGVPDTGVGFSNTNATGINLCAMIYVFDQDEAMTECCGCSASIDDFRTLSLNRDLTANPLNGRKSTRGLVKIVPADNSSNATCDPTTFSASGEFAAWSSHVQSTSDITETTFRPLLFTAAEQSFLQQTCAAIRELGSGQGTCSCGRGE